MFFVKNLNKSYGKRKVLSDISLDILPGECVGLLGINGSGKSTLLTILAGCQNYNSGSFGFTCNDASLSDKTISHRISSEHTLSFLPQENPLIEELSGWDNIKLWYNGKTKDILSSENKALYHQLGVDAFLKKKVNTMSGGMKKRLSLVISMMSKPDLLLLDEPMAALDIVCRNGILEYLKQYVRSGGSVLVATHEDSALSICDKVYILKNGILQLSTNTNHMNELF